VANAGLKGGARRLSFSFNGETSGASGMVVANIWSLGFGEFQQRPAIQRSIGLNFPAAGWVRSIRDFENAVLFFDH